MRVPARFVALAAGTLLALGLGEVLTRILIPDPYLAFENRIEMFQQDDGVGYRNRPNFRGYAQGTIPVRTNSLGYRGDEIATPKPPGAFRILGLGDSVTWGVGVREEKTYLRVLENALNSGRPQRKAREVRTS